jgi:hypothetical protein
MRVAKAIHTKLRMTYNFQWRKYYKKVRIIYNLSIGLSILSYKVSLDMTRSHKLHFNHLFTLFYTIYTYKFMIIR